MEKPVKPTEPLHKDYPIEQSTATYDSLYVRAYKKYQKDLERYNEDMEVYEQTKFIIDIQRSSLKLCLKKYKISLNKKP